MADRKCLICGCDLQDELSIGTLTVYNCPRCGSWAPLPPLKETPEHLRVSISEQLGPFDDLKSVRRRSRLSHIIRKQQEAGKQVGVRPDMLPQWGLDQPPPTPFEQLDALILWVGDHQPSPNEPAISSYLELSAWLGVQIARERQESNFLWLLGQEKCKDWLVSSAQFISSVGFNLTMNGWSRYQSLKEQQNNSKFAFMAMQFNDDALNSVFRDCFVPAVERTGFELRDLTDRQGAGLIDDQLRVALRNCRFVVADVTHGNNGAYWEAGFAEGLGKPVIYTCRENEWTERKVHFDTNHLVTIIWSPNDLNLAADRLAATIRATLPTEARLS